MITVEDMVRREVHYCVSYLVSTLAGGYGQLENAARMRESYRTAPGADLSELTEQAFELACPIDDWEEAAREAGWRVVSTFGTIRAIKNEAATDDDVTDFCSDEMEAWRAACEHDDLDPYQREVYEHWIVSDWLADQLIARGEKVDKDFGGMTVWARTTTGQAIAADSVIQAIHAALVESV